MGSVAGMDALTAEVRERDRAAYLAMLFAPEAARPTLTALAAYRLELSSIVARAREPVAAEIRLQWWRDAIHNTGYGENADVPLVLALREAMRVHHLPATTLAGMSEARIHDLYADPFGDWDAFDGYAGETWGAILQLGAMAAGVATLGDSEGLAAARTAATAAGYGAVALTAATAAAEARAAFMRGRIAIAAPDFTNATGLTAEAAIEAATLPDGFADGVAALVAHGQAADDAFRAAVHAVAPEVRSALLPATLARPQLKAAAKHMAQGDPPPAAPWQAPITLWRGARWLSRA